VEASDLKMGAFDVAAAITEFLADSACQSLELPHMTAGQRKSAKLLIDQYAEIRCESFGFGPERQLHLFKKADAPSGKVSFISAVTADSQIPSAELQVRNTFIHIEDISADNRAVKSMPHGMFRQCILSETVDEPSVAEIAEFPTTPSSMGTDPDTESTVELTGPLLSSPTGRLVPFAAGDLVIVEDLVKAPAFNGKSAIVQGFDKAAGRYDIAIASPAGCQQAKIKEENLRVVLPCVLCAMRSGRYYFDWCQKGSTERLSRQPGGSGFATMAERAQNHRALCS